MYERILVPTDGSTHSLRAAAHGAYLARHFDASIRLLHVVDVQRAAGVFDAGGIEEQFVDYLLEQGQSVLDETATALQGLKAIDRAVVEGEPADTLLDDIDADGADLVAMGTHGRRGLRRYLVGSVTERVVRRAPVPVLTVRATDRSHVAGGYDDVLIPTDGSTAAEAAVEHGLGVAERAGARVHSVFVVNEGELRHVPEDVSGAQLRRRVDAIGADATERIAAAAEERGLEAHTDERDGPPASDLLAHVDEEGIDLVAMGTAGQTGPSRFLLGSTAERIIRHAEVPVLAVNTREDPRA